MSSLSFKGKGNVIRVRLPDQPGRSKDQWERDNLESSAQGHTEMGGEPVWSDHLPPLQTGIFYVFAQRLLGEGTGTNPHSAKPEFCITHKPPAS
jgi:hypothetical protein